MRKVFIGLLWLSTGLFTTGSLNAQSGDDGSIHWKIANGMIAVTGEGVMPDYTSGIGSTSLWYSTLNSMAGVTIGKGVTVETVAPTCQSV